MAKKYFWLKIQEEFFRQKEIKALRKMEKGPLYILGRCERNAIIFKKNKSYRICKC